MGMAIRLGLVVVEVEEADEVASEDSVVDRSVEVERETRVKI